MLGRSVLYDNLFPSDLELNPGEQGQRNTFIERRDIKLAVRYYYWAHLQRKRYEDCLKNLSEEFDISPEQIIKRLKMKLDFVEEIRDANTTSTDLRKQYPYFSF